MAAVDHQAFAEAYLSTFNSAEAYHITHPKATRESCWAAGSRMLRNGKVKAIIADRLKEMAMEADEVLARFAMQARGDLSPFLKFEDGNVYLDLASPEARQYMYLVKKVQTSNRILKTTISKQAKEELIQQWVQIELHDPQNALTMIGRHLKLFTDKFEGSINHHIDGFEETMDKIYGSDGDETES
jgi:hypothetical protein